MNPMFEELSNNRQRQYNDAREDLLKAMHSFSLLDDAQKQQLILESINADALAAIYSVMRQHFG